MYPDEIFESCPCGRNAIWDCLDCLYGSSPTDYDIRHGKSDASHESEYPESMIQDYYESMHRDYVIDYLEAGGCIPFGVTIPRHL
jgi:hypothetical protein